MTTATARTTLHRLPDRGSYEQAAIHAVLDEALVCHVGFVHDDHPVVIPTTFARVGDHLYVHGSPASRMLRRVGTGIDVCVTVTLLDGLVLARSAFHHSMNYRSVVVFGHAQIVSDPAEKAAFFDALVNRVQPGRADRVRRPNEKEAKGTLVLRLNLAEASLKARAGGPIDDEADLSWPVWAGQIPLRLVAGDAVADG